MENNSRQLPEVDESALWVRTSKNGLKYLGGTAVIDGKMYKLLFFWNKFKTEVDTVSPDYYFKKK
jgi:hypothetical protein